MNRGCCAPHSPASQDEGCEDPARPEVVPGAERRGSRGEATSPARAPAQSCYPREPPADRPGDSDETGAAPARLCERCGSARDPHRHHRRLKQKGGSSNRAHTHCPCNAVTVCLTCHDEIHDRASRRRMEDEGWIVPQAVNGPGSVGVKRFAAAGGDTTRWPSCTGEWLETAAEALEAA